jgi:hypothetical protein
MEIGGNIDVNVPSMEDEIIIPDVSVDVESPPEIDFGALDVSAVSFSIVLYLNHIHSTHSCI